MKRIVLSAICVSILTCLHVRAEVASEAEMEQVCRNWLAVVVRQQGAWARVAAPEISGVREIVARDGTIVGRCYSISPRGYVVVPILKELPPIKAYSDEYGLDVDEKQGFPRLLREVLEACAQLYVRTHGDLRARQDHDDRMFLGRRHREEWDRFTKEPGPFAAELDRYGSNAVLEAGPLMTTKWHQFWPYNACCPTGDARCADCCPEDPDTCSPHMPTVVGCVATATAQIIRYHEWPSAGADTYNYYWDGDNSCDRAGNGRELAASFRDPYDWEDMPDSCGSECSPSQAAALAELCYEVGVAIEMDYGVCGSGAYTSQVLEALPRNFRYDPAMSYEIRNQHTPGSWFERLKTEIDHGRPVLYDFYGQEGDEYEGHALVCDGWRIFSSLNQIHMNYGWRTPHTDWYTLDNIYCPYDTCFVMEDGAVFNIKPLTQDSFIATAYPNPFRHNVTIHYFVPLRGPSSLAVYDVAGRFVQSLATETSDRGDGTVTWDGLDDNGKPVASGIYFVRLATQGQVRTAKIALLK